MIFVNLQPLGIVCLQVGKPMQELWGISVTKKEIGRSLWVSVSSLFHKNKIYMLLVHLSVGKIAHLQSEFPVSSYKFASSGIDNSLNSCSCANTTCSCCAHVVVPQSLMKKVGDDEDIFINLCW